MFSFARRFGPTGRNRESTYWFDLGQDLISSRLAIHSRILNPLHRLGILDEPERVKVSPRHFSSHLGIVHCSLLFGDLAPCCSHIQTHQRPQRRIIVGIQCESHDDLSSPSHNRKDILKSTIARNDVMDFKTDSHAVSHQVDPAVQPVVFQEPGDVGCHMFIIIRSLMR
jgi:hypothetical protein